ncbi:2352_t:CDS:2, partial [Acaulospora colombiana]
MALKYHSIENAYELDQRDGSEHRVRYPTYNDNDYDLDFYRSFFRPSIKEVLIILLMMFLIFEIMVTSLPLIDVREASLNDENEGLIIANHGAVASELDICSHIGVDVMKEGGSAVDAAIATELCIGSINAFSAGIGGYGKLPWRRLFEPSIKLCRDGFPVGPELAIRLKMYKSLMETDPAFRSIYAPSGRILEEGEMVYRRNFSRSLEIIADNHTEFYEGSIAKSLIREINSQGGIMTARDFANYKPIVREPIVGFYRGRKEHTFGPEYYHPVFDSIEDHGTTHISAVDKSEMSVSFTSTVNLIWGAQVMDPITGIILNDEMNDFSIPGLPNAFGLWPSPYNFVAPGKRPLSSTVPTIVERDGKFELALGGSGGTRILTAVLQ